MTFTLTKTRMALAVLVAVLAIPATAFATHVFDDVPDTAFYAAPVEWAFDNSITTGKSPTEFAPLDGVTRGESVTFLQRYNDNVAAPATEAAQSDADAAQTAADAAQTDADAAQTDADAAQTDADAAQTDADAAQSDADDNADAIADLPVTLWAVVDSDATLDRSSGDVTVVDEGTGEHRVGFSRNIRNCAYTATIGDSGSIGIPDAAFVTVVGAFADVTAVYVATYNDAGTEADRGFHLVVTCPPDEPIVLVATGAGAPAGPTNQSGN